MKRPVPFILFTVLTGMVMGLTLAFPSLLDAQSNSTRPVRTTGKDSFRFEHLTPEEGLPSLTVRSVVQDQPGFLWFATNNGLCRYDGYTFKTYHSNPRDPHSISTESINRLYEDSQGVLWVGTYDGGLNAFDRATEQFTRYLHNSKDPRSLSHNVIGAIHEDRSKRLWIGTDNGLDRLDRAGKQFTHYQHDPNDSHSLSYNVVATIVEDASGQLWVGTLGGGLNRFDPAGGKFTRYRHDPKNPNSLINDSIVAMAIDAKGSLWIGTTQGLDFFDPATGQFTHYKNDPNNPLSLSNDDISSLYIDASGEVWVGTTGSVLNILDTQKKAFLHCPSKPTNPDSLHGAWVLSIYADRSGALWITTAGDGVNRLDRAAIKFELYQHDPDDPNSLSCQGSIWSIFQSRLGALWVATIGGGLNRLDPITGRFKHYRHDPAAPQSLSDDQVFSLTEDRSGNLWVGTKAGLNRFDSISEKFTRYLHDPANPASLSENWVMGLHTDRRGRIWVGTFGKGLDLFDPATGGFRHYPSDPANPRSLSNNYILTFAEDPSGLLWIGTFGGGLNKFDPETGTSVCFLHDPANLNSVVSNQVEDIYLDQTGLLWLATPGGLERFDPQTKAFTHYAEQQGLASKAIASVVGDTQGNLWVGMQGSGLARFDPRSETFKNYDRSSGLQGGDFSPRGAYRDANGKLYFGGINGLNAFYPDRLPDNPFVPPVVLTEFRIFNQAVPIGGQNSPLRQIINATDEISLSYQQSAFSFDFAALNYRMPRKNRYAYKLEGFDKNWNYVDSSRRFAAYTSLKPDSYTFRVKAANNDGVWNDVGKSVKIIITPPWWRTGWFYSLAIASILGVGFSIYRSKSNQIKSLQAAERKYREVFNATSDALIIQDNACRILDVNDRMCIMFSCTHEAALGLSIGDISLGKSPYSQIEAEDLVRRAVQTGPQVIEWQSRRRNGELFWSEVALHASEIAGEKRVIASIRDITGRKRLEEQLLQAQKMESIGRLAGGVAHDFNNLLTTISGNTELALMEKSQSPNVVECLKAVEKAAANAADLTKQLLAFSRKQIIEQKVIDLNALIKDMENMLRRLIGEDITLQTFAQPGMHLIKIDPGQMHQIVMNLAVNARDSMPNGGTLTLEISAITLDDAYCRLHSYATPGENILLAVTDTGSGMTEEVKKHLFEPFFTTKSTGKGTGLGLATVYGAVKQNNGTIEVYSEPEKGTCFKIYFPKATGDRDSLITPSYEMSRTGGTETLLVVEDDYSVLSYSRKMLTSLGYHILTASSGEEALRVAQEHNGEIRLLITDVILPGMNGRKIADMLTERYPGLKVLYCSGYTENTIVHHGVLDPQLHFIGKPYNITSLSRKIRELLDTKE